MGALGLLTIVLYTPWLNRFPYLCLIAPGVGFGLIMVNGTYIALTSQLSLSAFVLSLIVFCLVNNLLLLNQFPDAHADKQVGRNHFVIAKGFRASAITYIAFVAVCFALVVYLLLNAYLPSAAWWILISLPIGLLVGVKAMRLTQTQFDTRISELLPYMGLNVMLSLCVPLALALVLWMYR
jgi:1,4-dihydroxy-2-naphthoate octaprenyltransferase